MLDLQGHLTPTHLFYVVQHFAVPELMRPENWRMSIAGEVQQASVLTYEEIRRLLASTVRTLMECLGSDVDFFEYFKRQRSRPVHTQEGMILSAGGMCSDPTRGGSAAVERRLS